MAEVLVAVMPFAGHVAPMSHVVRTLRDAGHVVRVYTGAAYRQRFEALGAQFLPWTAAPDFDEHDLPATFPQAGRGGPAGLLATLEHVFIRSAPAQATDLLAAFDRRPWDLILADSLSLGAALAAERTGTRWATVSVVPLTMLSRDLPPPNLPIAPARTVLGRVRDVDLHAVVAVATTGLRRAHRLARAAAGLPPRGRRLSRAWFSPQLVLALGVPGLEAPRSDLPEHVHFIGAFPPSGGPLPDWWSQAVDGGRPIVHVTQGTFDLDADRLLRPALAALADRPVTVVAATGTRSRTALPFAVPANAFVGGLLPYRELLPRTSIMVTNGGWGGVTAALAHGIPLVVAGADLDKPMIAAAVQRAGAGVDLRTGTPAAGQVAAAVERIDREPSFRRHAARLAAEFAAHDTAALLVELVGRLLADPAPVRRAAPVWPDHRPPRLRGSRR